MTVPLSCLVLLVFIPYLLAGAGAWQRKVQLGEVDNKNWRATQLPKLTGVASRIYSAQANTWEAIGLFTVCVVAAHLAGADAQQSAIAAVIFLAARVIYTVLYLADLDKLRTAVFLVGQFACLRLMYLAAIA